VAIIGTIVLAAAAQQLEAIADDLGRVALDAFLVGILFGLYPALDVDLTPFAKILTGNLCLPAKQRYTLPLRTFLCITLLILVAF
jgi:hypothetical protein